jgi:hypothetical protein
VSNDLDVVREKGGAARHGDRPGRVAVVLPWPRTYCAGWVAEGFFAVYPAGRVDGRLLRRTLADA